MDFPSYSLYGEGVHGANIAAWIAVKRREKVQALILASPGYPAEYASLGRISHNCNCMTDMFCDNQSAATRPNAAKRARGLARE